MKYLPLYALLLIFAGCTATSASGPQSSAEEERWNRRNSPRNFDSSLVYEFANLPQEGRSERDAWPSTYWPTYDDSINTRWQGNSELSPAEKYDRAFNGWVPTAGFEDLRPFNRYSPTDFDPEYYEQLGPLAKYVSRHNGNRRDREEVLSWPCSDQNVSDCDLSERVRPDDFDEWPVETWWGLCHAWTPAAILEDRPLKAVEHNGITFEVADIEALLIAAYNRAPADMLGDRCNRNSGDEADKVERDEFGRITNEECRDSNPGAMHVAITNYLGLRKEGIAMDRTYDYQVWNQPIVGYKIYEQVEITAEEANELLMRDGVEYHYNNDASKFFRVHMGVDWLGESHASRYPADSSNYTRRDHFRYILEVDAQERVIGGEWYGASRDAHPDFLWNPRRLHRSSFYGIDLEQVRELVRKSRGEVDVEPEPFPDGFVGIRPNSSIPDNNVDGITSTLNTNGHDDVIESIDLNLEIEHTYIGDLLVTLKHEPSETSFSVHNFGGGSNDNLEISMNITDFAGLEPNAEWTLSVSDHARADVGRLSTWSIRVNTAPANVGCQSDSQCGDTTPFCDLESGECVECALDAHCGDAESTCQARYCEADNRCVTETLDDGISCVTEDDNDGECEAARCVPVSVSEERNILITEIMANPATVADYRGEWFELYNAGSTAVSLDGCEVGNDRSSTSIEGVSIPAGGRVILARSTSANVVPDALFSFPLSNRRGILDFGCDGESLVTVFWRNARSGQSFHLDPDGYSLDRAFRAEANESPWCIGEGTPRGSYECQQ